MLARLRKCIWSSSTDALFRQNRQVQVGQPTFMCPSRTLGTWSCPWNLSCKKSLDSMPLRRGRMAGSSAGLLPIWQSCGRKSTMVSPPSCSMQGGRWSVLSLWWPFVCTTTPAACWWRLQRPTRRMRTGCARHVSSPVPSRRWGRWPVRLSSDSSGDSGWTPRLCMWDRHTAPRSGSSPRSSVCRPSTCAQCTSRSSLLMTSAWPHWSPGCVQERVCNALGLCSTSRSVSRHWATT
mmetsp:Transcript_17670/g.41492  ORF Transcript_17670/g.41492 Transcript_17670/m.41492 type:complete len:236 (-) Transcript_17670:429-1136(-)